MDNNVINKTSQLYQSISKAERNYLCSIINLESGSKSRIKTINNVIQHPNFQKMSQHERVLNAQLIGDSKNLTPTAKKRIDQFMTSPKVEAAYSSPKTYHALINQNGIGGNLYKNRLKIDSSGMFETPKTQPKPVHDQEQTIINRGMNMYQGMTPQGRRYLMANLRQAKRGVKRLRAITDPNSTVKVSDYAKRNQQYLHNLAHGIVRSKNRDHHPIKTQPVPDDELKKVKSLVDDQNATQILQSGSIIQALRRKKNQQITRRNEKHAEFQKQIQADLHNNHMALETERGSDLYKNLSRKGKYFMKQYVDAADLDMGHFNNLINKDPDNHYEKKQIQRLDNTAKGIRKSRNDGHIIQVSEPIPSNEYADIMHYLKDPQVKTTLAHGALDPVINPKLARTAQSRMNKIGGTGESVQADRTKINPMADNDPNKSKMDEANVKPKNKLGNGNYPKLSKSEEANLILDNRRFYKHLSKPGRKLMTVEVKMATNDIDNYERVTGKTPDDKLNPIERKERQSLEDVANGQIIKRTNDPIHINNDEFSKDPYKPRTKSQKLDRFITNHTDYDRRDAIRMGHHAWKQRQDRYNNKSILRSVTIGQPVDHHEFKAIQEHLHNGKMYGMLMSNKMNSVVDELNHGIHKTDSLYGQQMKHLTPVQEENALNDGRRFRNLLSDAGKNYLRAQTRLAATDMNEFNRVNYANKDDLSIHELEMRHHLGDLANGGIKHKKLSFFEHRDINNFLRRNDMQQPLANGRLNKVVNDNNMQEIQDMESRGNDTREQNHISKHAPKKHNISLSELTNQLEAQAQQSRQAAQNGINSQEQGQER